MSDELSNFYTLLKEKNILNKTFTIFFHKKKMPFKQNCCFKVSSKISIDTILFNYIEFDNNLIAAKPYLGN